MHGSARPRNCARVLVTAVLFAAFCWTLLAIVSPQSHARVHADANQADHVCAVTLIASGSYEQVDQPQVISAPQPNVRFHERTLLTSSSVRPLFFYAHIFAHGPPAHS